MRPIGTPLPILSWRTVMRPIRTAVRRYMAVVLLLSGCGGPGPPPWQGGGGRQNPISAVAPLSQAEADLEAASAAYDKRQPAAEVDLSDLTLKSALVLAVDHNRFLRQRTYRTQRFGLERDIRKSDLDRAGLFSSYAVQEGADRSFSRSGAIGRVGGFEIEPFIEFVFEESEDERTTTSYGVAVSRSIFRIKHEYMRQVLPLTQATKDYHIAINQRILELRDLHLDVVQRFYDVERFISRVKVRQHRVEDAQEFLSHVHQLVINGMSAANEETNAQISLNQAEADLIREQTNLEDAKDNLLDLLGIDFDQDVTIRSDRLDDSRRLTIELAEDLYLVGNRHERILNQFLEIEVQRQQHLISKDELIPDLTATLTAAQDVDRRRTRENVALDFSLSVPLDGYRAEKARASQDRLRLMELSVELSAIESDLRRQLRASHRAIEELNGRVRLVKRRLDEERKKLAARIQIYEKQSGANNSLEVTRAKEAVDNAELELLDLRVGRITEEARYRSLLPEAGETSLDSDEAGKERSDD